MAFGNYGIHMPLRERVCHLVIMGYILNGGRIWHLVTMGYILHGEKIWHLVTMGYI